jgi:hypothetical protein
MKLNKKGVKQFDDNLVDNGEFSDMTATIMDSPTVYKNLKKCRGEAFLFKMSPPFQGHEYIVESTIPSETMYFPADKYGKVKDFLNLPLDLDKEGYEIV